jgi:hypothetical protein
MGSLGINLGVIIFRLIPAMLLIGFPMISLIDLAKNKLTGTPLALSVLLICAVPFLGPLAYGIIKPTAESQV